MKRNRRNNERVSIGYPRIKWRTVHCPFCEAELRLWWASKGHVVKTFLCRYCRRLFHMDRFGIVQSDLYEIIPSDYGSLGVVREKEEENTTE